MVIAKLGTTSVHLHTRAENQQRPTIPETRATLAQHYTCPPVVIARMHFWMILVSLFALGFTFGLLLFRSTMRL